MIFEADISGSNYSAEPSKLAGVDADYIWDGWFSDAACTVPYTFDTMPANTLIVFTKWHAPSYTVTFHLNYDGAAPVIGIAIGQDIQTSGTDVGADGRTYDVIEKKSFLSILTAEKLSFYQGENEVAYLSNNQLYITAAHILDRIEMGDGWQLGSENGFTVKWVGG